MATSKKDASKAGKFLATAKTAPSRSVAGSDLSQRKGFEAKAVSKHGSITQNQADSAVRKYLSKEVSGSFGRK
jgi:hypothetical protein